MCGLPIENPTVTLRIHSFNRTYSCGDSSRITLDSLLKSQNEVLLFTKFVANVLLITLGLHEKNYIATRKMVVQTHFPQKLSPKRYDSYLASGWFRGSVMLYKMDLLCLENDLYSVINIRLNLEKHILKKSLSKINRRGKAKFRVEFGNVQLNDQKEELYQFQKTKFQGFIHQSLHDFLYSGLNNTVFDTKEVCVYDGDRLVACSYFDLGEKSIASLLGLHHPKYASYSLGIFTMLLEIEFAKESEVKWYYPGYVLNEDKGFEYKLRLGNYEYYNSNKRWSNYSQFNSDNVISKKVNQRNDLLKEKLKENEIAYKKWLYPYFGIGYMNMWDISFLKAPVLLEIAQSKNHKLVAAYDVDDEEYQLFWAEHAIGHEQMVSMALSENMKGNDNLLLKLQKYSNYLLQTTNVTELISYLKNDEFIS